MLTCIHTYINIHTYITYMYISVLLLNNWLQKYPYMHTYIHTICQSAYFHPRTRAFAARPGRRERSRCWGPDLSPRLQVPMPYTPYPPRMVLYRIARFHLPWWVSHDIHTYTVQSEISASRIYLLSALHTCIGRFSSAGKKWQPFDVRAAQRRLIVNVAVFHFEAPFIFPFWGVYQC